jgi:cation transport ATPase
MIPIEQISIGDTIIVQAGEVFPVDGLINLSECID